MRNRRRILMDELQERLDDSAHALIDRTIELAMAGHPMALRLALERVLPVPKGRPLSVPLPIDSGYDSLVRALLAAVSDGELSASEAATLANMASRPTALLALQRAIGGIEFKSRDMTALPEGTGQPCLPGKGSHEKSGTFIGTRAEVLN